MSNARNYGYIRVSSKEQNIDRQIDELRKIGTILERDIYIDKKSGKDFDRTEYQKVKNALREGDCLFVTSIDRFGRNAAQIIKEWEHVTTVIKADICITQSSYLDTRNCGTANDVDGLFKAFIQKVILELSATLAQVDRLNIKTRQEQGIAAAKKRGKKFGRPCLKMPDNFYEIYSKWEKKEIAAVDCIKLLNISKTKFYEFANAIKDKLQQ